MGIPVLILGESGSGKSSSLRNFGQADVEILNVAKKPLPFRNTNQLNVFNLDRAKPYQGICNELKKAEYKSYVIDDSQYLLTFEMFGKAKETGYTKFTDMALNFYNLIQYIIEQTPDNCIVYYLHHVDSTADGRIKAKTIGKMLDEKLTVEGLFSIVLMASTDGNKYVFETKNNGMNTVKTPIGMFEQAEIENDLKAVDTAIREYYNM